MKTDLAAFLGTLLFVSDEPFRDSTIRDFHPEFQSAAESFLNGFRDYLAAHHPDLDPDAGERSFGGNVFFSLSGHGCGFWDDSDSEWGKAMDAALKAYSASLPGGGILPDLRFHELESSLMKRRGGKIDLAILSKYLPAARRRMFGQPEPTVAVFRTFGNGGEVIALFPEIPGDVHGHYCESYQHTGQHGAAYPGAIPGTRPATPEEIEPLKRELESIGYTLTIRRHVTRAMDAKRSALNP